jgi:hypothetical protein
MSLLKRIAELIARPPAGTMPHEAHAAEVLAQELRTRSAESAETLSRAARAAEAKQAEMTLQRFKQVIETARKSELALLESQAAQAVLARAALPLSPQVTQPAPKPAPAPAPAKPATKSHKETILDAFRTGVAGEMAKPAPKPAASIGRDHSGQPVPRPAAKPAAAKPAPPPPPRGQSEGYQPPLDKAPADVLARLLRYPSTTAAEKIDIIAELERRGATIGKHGFVSTSNKKAL